jgi:hypothetical protein
MPLASVASTPGIDFVIKMIRVTIFLRKPVEVAGHAKAGTVMLESQPGRSEQLVLRRAFHTPRLNEVG